MDYKEMDVIYDKLWVTENFPSLNQDCPQRRLVQDTVKDNRPCCLKDYLAIAASITLLNIDPFSVLFQPPFENYLH